MRSSWCALAICLLRGLVICLLIAGGLYVWLLQPAWMIPPIGICMASGSAHELRVPGPIDLFFYFAFLSFLVLFPAIIYRWHFWPKV